jgi:hypothetical protein
VIGLGKDSNLESASILCREYDAVFLKHASQNGDICRLTNKFANDFSHLITDLAVLLHTKCLLAFTD